MHLTSFKTRKTVEFKIIYLFFYIIHEVFYCSSFQRYSFQGKLICLYTLYTETKRSISGLTNVHRPKRIPALFRLKEKKKEKKI